MCLPQIEPSKGIFEPSRIVRRWPRLIRKNYPDDYLSHFLSDEVLVPPELFKEKVVLPEDCLLTDVGYQWAMKVYVLTNRTKNCNYCNMQLMFIMYINALPKLNSNLYLFQVFEGQLLSGLGALEETNSHQFCYDSPAVNEAICKYYVRCIFYSCLLFCMHCFNFFLFLFTEKFS